MTEMRRSSSGTAVQLKPHLDSISPQSGPPEGGFTVTIAGTGLTGVRKVIFCGQEATDVKATATQVTCMAPANNHGACQVHVINNENKQSNKIPFDYS
jgi:hypothetical protein